MEDIFLRVVHSDVLFIIKNRREWISKDKQSILTTLAGLRSSLAVFWTRDVIGYHNISSSWPYFLTSETRF